MARQIRIVGTSHISSESKSKVHKVIEQLRPQCVCVELDRARLAGLRSKVRRQPSAREMIRRVGVQGYVFSAIAGWAQRKLGDQAGMTPGAEMLAAVDAAAQVGARVALVDQDIEVTLRRLRLTWRERFRLLWDVVKGVFGFGTPLPFDVQSVPDKSLINMLLEETRERYPTVYRVLVTERNEVMARRIAGVARGCEGDVVVVLGAGHEEEVAELVQKYLRQQTSL